jgi:hypothetical protein
MRTRVTLVVLALAVLACPPSAGAATTSGHWDHSFPARPGMTVTIDASFHEVEVTARPGATVDVVVDVEVRASAGRAERLVEELTPVFTSDGSDILIRSTRSRGFRFDLGSTSTRGRIAVDLPPGLDLVCDTSSGSCSVIGDLGDAAVSCDTSSGEVRVEGAMRSLSADTSSGGVGVSVSRPLQAFRADTSSGEVWLVGGAVEATADTSSGSVELRDMLGEVSVDTSSGDVEVRWASIPADARIRVDTSSGGVSLELPAGTRLRGVVDTSSGGIRSDFGGSRSDRGHHLQLEDGPGAVGLHVDTTSGGVKILAR